MSKSGGSHAAGSMTGEVIDGMARGRRRSQQQQCRIPGGLQPQGRLSMKRMKQLASLENLGGIEKLRLFGLFGGGE